MNAVGAVREIATVRRIAAHQAERNADETRLAVLRQKVPGSDLDKPTDLRHWVLREGNMAALSERLKQVAGGQITILYEPGAPAIERVGAIAEGISRELPQQKTIAQPIPSRGRDDLER